jgi:hypothetical protein
MAALQPAAPSVLTRTIANGSRSDNHCVRLLSIAQRRQAAASSTSGELCSPGAGLELDQRAAEEDERRCDQRSAAAVLADQGHREQDRERRLEIEQQRSGQRADALETSSTTHAHVTDRLGTVRHACPVPARERVRWWHAPMVALSPSDPAGGDPISIATDAATFYPTIDELLDADMRDTG